MARPLYSAVCQHVSMPHLALCCSLGPMADGKQGFHSGAWSHQRRGSPPTSPAQLLPAFIQTALRNLDSRILLPGSPWLAPPSCLMPTAALVQPCQRALDPSVIKMSHWSGERCGCTSHCSCLCVCSSQDGSLVSCSQLQVGILARVGGSQMAVSPLLALSCQRDLGPIPAWGPQVVSCVESMRLYGFPPI